MSTIPDSAQRILRQAFKGLNGFMLLNWRLGLGPYISFWPFGIGRFMVLNHIGRKSGLPRRTPVNYAEVNGEIYITSGFGKVAHWYKNIMAHPHIEVWLPDGAWQAYAEDVTNCEQHITIMREVLKNSGFAALAGGVNPHTMSDVALAQATDTYRLLHIHRIAPSTNEDGLGDLVWIWPFIGTVLIVMWLLGKRRNSA